MKIKKFLIVSWVILFLIEVIILYYVPLANGYELSIYEQYPSYFWIIFFVLYTYGISFIIFFSDNKNENIKSVLLGIIIIIFTNSLFLLIPTFRYYPIWGHGDIHTHLGYIKDILVTGNLGKNNFYPIVHIIGAVIVNVLGLPLLYLSSVINVIFFIIFLINMFLISFSFSKYYGKSYFIILCFSTPLIYGALFKSLHPSFISIFIMPLVIYLTQERSFNSSFRFERTILLVISSLFITFCHPVTTLLLFLFLITMKYSYKIRYIINNKIIEQKYNTGSISLIITIIFFSWYFTFPSVHYNINSIFEWFYDPLKTNLLMETLDPLAEAKLNISQLLLLFINKYGSRFIYLFMSGILCLKVIYNEIFNRKDCDSVKFSYSICYLMSLLFVMFEFTVYLIEQAITRALRLSLLISPILIGLTLSDFVNRDYNKKTKLHNDKIFKIIIMIILILISSLTFLNMYGSSRVYAPNSQVTTMEVEGAKWFEEKKNQYIKVLHGSPSDIHRFRDLTYGVELYNLTKSRYGVSRLPSHFGYGESGYVLETYSNELRHQDFYIILNERIKISFMAFPENVRPLVHQYNNSDIYKLNKDKTVSKIYSNGDFELWKISLPSSHPSLTN